MQLQSLAERMHVHSAAGMLCVLRIVASTAWSPRSLGCDVICSGPASAALFAWLRQ